MKVIHIYLKLPVFYPPWYRNRMTSKCCNNLSLVTTRISFAHLRMLSSCACLVRSYLVPTFTNVTNWLTQRWKRLSFAKDICLIPTNVVFVPIFLVVCICVGYDVCYYIHMHSCVSWYSIIIFVNKGLLTYFCQVSIYINNLRRKVFT